MRELAGIQREVIACRRCPRLVQWREAVAGDPPRRFRGQRYWARGVPSFGDPDAALLIVGLAPAAHGANRTGRMFTGDRSGDFLYASLHRVGVANMSTSERADDGLRLRGVWITAMVRCAPPGNVPSRDERRNCADFLEREMGSLRPRVILALGGLAWSAVLRLLRDRAPEVRRPPFGHAAEVDLAGLVVLASYPRASRTPSPGG